MARAAALSSRSATSVRSPRAPPMRRSGRSMRPSGGIGRRGDDRPVGLLHRPAAECRRELRCGARRAGEQQHARGVTVQPVHQARAIRRTEAQRIEQRVQMMGDARPALHRHAVRLVQHQQVIVAMEHQPLQVARGVRVDVRNAASQAVRREAAECAPTGRRRDGSPASARWPSTRTCPVRHSFWIAPCVRPGKCRRNQRSSRMSASSAETTRVAMATYASSWYASFPAVGDERGLYPRSLSPPTGQSSGGAGVRYSGIASNVSILSLSSTTIRSLNRNGVVEISIRSR